MQATAELTHLDAPVDAMRLIHKALRAEAGRVEDAVNQLELGGSFKPFQRVFYRWALALGYHVITEDQYITSQLIDAALLQQKEAEQACVLEMLEALQTYLHEDLDRMIVIPRTQRQLRHKVIALRIAQEDLLEEEEEYILPFLRQHLPAAQQLQMIKHLLIDEEAEEQTEILDWVAADLAAGERQLLADLQAQF
ncbi:MAG: hypothetical protein AB7N91_11395 [Candidatus Tectimicrobiota bacterium]